MKLLLIHGRSQEDKNPAVLENKWLTALYDGAELIGRDLPITEEDIFFPFFGDALRDLTGDEEALTVAPVTLGSEHRDDEEFRCKILNDCLGGLGVHEEHISEAAPPEVVVDGPLQREWVQIGIGLLDRISPSFSSQSLALAAADVAQYLQDEAVQDFIECGILDVMNACEPDEKLVVVGHSLGSIVAYRLLRREGVFDRPIELLMTLGSPLGITAVREALAPIGFPAKVDRWFNAYDNRDAVALHPLNDTYFNVKPSIENYGDIENNTKNHHGIGGYLTDPVVATRLMNALAAEV